MIRTVHGIRRNLLAALCVVLMLGGTVAAWSVYVPLEGVVVARIVVVESNLRKVQHRTGGAVSVLDVREGQRVEAGDIVVRLDDTMTGTRPVIPNNPTRRRAHPFDARTYRRRNVIERTFSRLKDFRRIATRYDKLASSFLAAVAIASIVSYWL